MWQLNRVLIVASCIGLISAHGALAAEVSDYDKLKASCNWGDKDGEQCVCLADTLSNRINAETIDRIYDASANNRLLNDVDRQIFILAEQSCDNRGMEEFRNRMLSELDSVINQNDLRSPSNDQRSSPITSASITPGSAAEACGAQEVKTLLRSQLALDLSKGFDKRESFAGMARCEYSPQLSNIIEECRVELRDRYSRLVAFKPSVADGKFRQSLQYFLDETDYLWRFEINYVFSDGNITIDSIVCIECGDWGDLPTAQILDKLVGLVEDIEGRAPPLCALASVPEDSFMRLVEGMQ